MHCDLVRLFCGVNREVWWIDGLGFTCIAEIMDLRRPSILKQDYRIAAEFASANFEPRENHIRITVFADRVPSAEAQRMIWEQIDGRLLEHIAKARCNITLEIEVCSKQEMESLTPKDRSIHLTAVLAYRRYLSQDPD